MVEIYTKKGYPYCAAAKEGYNRRGEPFTEIDVHQNLQKAEKVFQKTGRRIVPINVNGAEVQLGFNGY